MAAGLRVEMLGAGNASLPARVRVRDLLARARSPEVSLRRRSHCASSRRWPTTPRSTISTPRAGRRAGQPRVGQPGAESRPGGGRRVDDRGRRGAAGRAAGGVRGHVPPRPRCVPSQRLGDRRCCCRLDAVGVAPPTRATRGCCGRCRDRCRAEVLGTALFPWLAGPSGLAARPSAAPAALRGLPVAYPAGARPGPEPRPRGQEGL
jgi:hypothetical protein